MRKREPSVNWTVLYILTIGAIGLLWLEGRAALTPFEHKLALIGVVLVYFAVTHAWLTAESRRWR